MVLHEIFIKFACFLKFRRKYIRGKMLTHEAEIMLESASPYLLDVEKTVILQKTESIFIAFLLFISQKI